MKQVIKTFIKFSGPNKYLLYWSLILAAISAPLGDIVSQFLFSRILDRLSKHSFDDMLLLLLGSFILALLLRFFTSRYSISLMQTVQTDTMKRMSNTMAGHFFRQSITWFKSKDNAVLVDKQNQFPKSFEDTYDTFGFHLVGNFSTIPAIYIFLLYYVPYFGIGICLSSGLFVYWIYKISMKNSVLFKNARRSKNRMNELLSDQIENITSIIGYGREDYETTKYETVSNIYYEKLLHAWEKNSAIRAYIDFFPVVMASVSLGITCYMMYLNTLLFADFILVNTLVTSASYKISSLGKVLKTLRQSITDAQESIQILETDAAVVDTGEIELEALQTIEFKDVTFRYPNTKKNIFEKFNMLIPAGRKYAIVGPSGSGKSTLLQILRREMEIEDGQILINGIDYREYKLSTYRAAFANVPQHPTLFNATLLENIVYARPDASEQDVKRILEISQAEEIVEKYPERLTEKGFDNFSGGEKQRVAIARALLSMRPVVLMDEPTSALDAGTEANFKDAIDRIPADYTTITVAHRLSTIKDVDQIFVLRDGKLIETGTHQTLIEKNGEYAEMVKIQSMEF